MTRAFRSTLDLSSTVPGGLLMRQTHHWAALVFVAAMVVHLLRVFFTGAYRRPRELTWLLGVGLLAHRACSRASPATRCPTTCSAGWAWPSPTAVALSIPLLGGSIGALVWGGQFPGPGVIESRLYILHVFVLPAVMAALIAAHLALVVRHKHTQFAGPGRREGNVVGTPMWPGYALRSLGLLFAVAARARAPRRPRAGQPGLAVGPLRARPRDQRRPARLVPGLAHRRTAAHAAAGDPGLRPHARAQPFWGGIAFPGVVFTMLAAWPFLEPRLLRDRARHDLLDRPREHPWRTAFGVAFFSWVALIFVAGAADRLFYQFGISYTSQVHLFRALTLIAPPSCSWPRRSPATSCAARRSGPGGAGREGACAAARTRASTSSATGGDETAACHHRGSGKRGASAHRCLGDL